MILSPVVLRAMTVMSQPLPLTAPEGGPTTPQSHASGNGFVASSAVPSDILPSYVVLQILVLEMYLFPCVMIG